MKTKLVKCSNCNYEWKTKSKKIHVTCPNCLRKIKLKELKGGMK